MIPILNTKEKIITYKLSSKKDTDRYSAIYGLDFVESLKNQENVRDITPLQDRFKKVYSLFDRHTMNFDVDEGILLIRTSNEFKGNERRALEAMVPEKAQLNLVPREKN